MDNFPYSIEEHLAFSSRSHLRETYESPYGNVRFGRLLEFLDVVAGNTCFNHTGSSSTFVTASVDRVNFLKPVEVGDTIEFDAAICYVGNSSMNVEVDVKRRDSGSVTNTCSFTFVAVDEVGEKVDVPKVYPENRERERIFLRGFRRYQRITAQRLRPF